MKEIGLHKHHRQYNFLQHEWKQRVQTNNPRMDFDIVLSKTGNRPFVHKIINNWKHSDVSSRIAQ